jgi:hypothetical protein
MVIEIELIPDLLVNSVGDANGAGAGESLEAGGDVDAVTEDVSAINDHVAEIDTDSEFETPVGRDGVVDGASRSLDLDGAVERVDNTRKIRKKAVPRRADDPPATGGD